MPSRRRHRRHRAVDRCRRPSRCFTDPRGTRTSSPVNERAAQPSRPSRPDRRNRPAGERGGLLADPRDRAAGALDRKGIRDVALRLPDRTDRSDLRLAATRRRVGKSAVSAGRVVGVQRAADVRRRAPDPRSVRRRGHERRWRLDRARSTEPVPPEAMRLGPHGAGCRPLFIF